MFRQHLIHQCWRSVDLSNFLFICHTVYFKKSSKQARVLLEIETIKIIASIPAFGIVNTFCLIFSFVEGSVFMKKPLDIQRSFYS